MSMVWGSAQAVSKLLSMVSFNRRVGRLLAVMSVHLLARSGSVLGKLFLDVTVARNTVHVKSRRVELIGSASEM